MPKLQIKATELVDTNVDFVSLVKRGANRIPFRITKEDEPMLDLHKISRSLFAKAETKPEITAAVVPAGTDTEVLAKVFKDAGLEPKVFVKKEIDGVVTLAKADADKAEDTVIIKTGDKIGLVVSGLKKAFDSYSGTSDFGTAIKAQSFYPSFCTAREVLSDCVSVALHKSNSPAEAAERIGETVADFRSYVTALASALPASAFYVDRYYADMMKAEGAAPAGGNVAKDETSDAAAGVEKAATDKKKDKETEEAAVGDDAAKAAAKKTEDDVAAAKQPDAGAVSDEIAALKKSNETVLGAIEGLQKAISSMEKGLKEDVRKELADVNDRIEKVAEQARKTDAALNGTVFGEAEGDKQRRVEKNDDVAGAPPLLDTAYHRIEAA